MGYHRISFPAISPPRNDDNVMKELKIEIPQLRRFSINPFPELPRPFFRSLHVGDLL